MKNILAKFDLILIAVLFLLTLPAEYFESMSLLENQTVAFRHMLRNSYGDSSLTSFPADKVLLATIDDQFYEAYGGHPLKRSDLARIVENLDALGARVIACNFFLKYRDIYEEDKLLARVLEKAENALLASQVVFDRRNDAMKFHYPASPLKDAAETGYINLTPVSTVLSSFRRLRFYPDLADIEGGMPLAALAVAKYMDGDIQLEGRTLKIEGLLPIRLDHFGEIHIDFSFVPEKSGSIATRYALSGFDFLDIGPEGSDNRRRLKDAVAGKIVVIGDSSELSNDWYDTPVGRLYGSEILAHCIATILKNAPLKPAGFVAESVCAFFVFFSIFLIRVFVFEPKVRTLFAFLVFVLFAHVATSFYVYAGVVLSMSYNLVFGALAFIAVSLIAYVKEANIKNQIAGKLREKQRYLEKAEEKYRSIYENAADGIFQTDTDGVFVDANPSMACIMGFDRPLDILADRIDMAASCFREVRDGREFFETLRLEEKIVGLEQEFRRRDNSCFKGILSARAVRDDLGNIMYYEGSLQDITERVLKEQAERAREAAEAKEKAKSEFWAMINHDIRNPLGAIRMGLETVSANPSLSPKERKDMETLKNNCDKVKGILDDSLDLSKMEAGGMELHMAGFDLRKEMENLVDLHRQSTAAKKVELILDIDPEIPPMLVGDCFQIGKVVENLLTNAVKFTSRGEISVGVDCLGKSDTHARLSFYVSDTGIGLSDEQARRIFSPYAQADRPFASNTGGTGLGLYICKTGVELMGSAIDVESKPGAGSRFFFELKLDVPPDTAYERPALPLGLKRIQALVVDDSPASGRMLERALKSLGCDPVCVETLDRAREVFQSDNKTFDIVLIDSDMPDCEATSPSDAFWMDGPDKRVPAVFMSAFGDGHLSDGALPGVASAFLSKPVKYGDLLDAILEAMGFGQTAAQEPEEKRQRPRLPGGFRNTRILLAEDDAINQHFVSEILEAEGLRVSVAINGREAVKAVFENHFDLVFLDCRMPVMDGLEAAVRIRRDPRFKELPLIGLSASASDEDREKGLAAGMNDYLVKPVETGDLFSAVRRWVSADKVEEHRAVAIGKGADDANDAPWPADLPGIDLQSAKEKYSDNQSFFVDLVLRFAKEYEGVPHRLRQAAARRDWDSIRGILHKLRATLPVIKARRLPKLAEDIRNACLSEDMDTLEILLDDFEIGFDQVLTSACLLDENRRNAQAARSRKVPNDVVAADSREMKRNFLELKDLLEEHNLRADDFLRSIMQHVSDANLVDSLQRIAKNVERLDFASARHELRALERDLEGRGE